MGAPHPDTQTPRKEAREIFQEGSGSFVPTLVTPGEMSDRAFLKAKRPDLASPIAARSCRLPPPKVCGTAIPNFEQSCQSGLNIPDPVNLYLLGIANENDSHFDDAG